MKGNAQTLGDCTMSWPWYCSLRERGRISGGDKRQLEIRLRSQATNGIPLSGILGLGEKTDFSCAVTGLGRSSRVKFFLYRGSRLVASAEGSRPAADTDKSRHMQKKFFWHPE